MNKIIPYIKYKCFGATWISKKLENDHFSTDFVAKNGKIKVEIIPKTEIELIEYKLTTATSFSDSDYFFANGYQSWTTSTEYSAKHVAKGMTPIANVSSFTKGLVGLSGDYSFEKYGKRGLFHSYTYTYIRRADKLRFFGSLSEKNGYTIFRIDLENNKFIIAKDVEGVVIKDKYTMFDIVVFNGGYDDVFNKYFDAMNIRKPKIDHLSGYTSWYNYFQNINEDIILRDLDALDEAKDAVSVFQIDDGYETAVGDWLKPNDKKFPCGMKYSADKIHEKGYLAGIWLAPFNAQISSELYKKHKNDGWFIKDNNTGKPLIGCAGWGGAYTLDFYNPEVKAYIKHFFDVVVNEWGYDMVKLDFLYSEAMQPRNGKSRGQIMCEALEFLRECVGDKLILGCGVPLGAAFGVVDACRISCDVDLNYNGKFYNKLHVNAEIPSAQNAVRNTIFRRHLNGRAFCSDPDVFFLRDSNLNFTKEQKLLLCKINNLFGDVLFVSDNADEYSQQDLDYMKKFFKKSTAVVKSVYEFADNEFEIVYEENKEEKTLLFNLRTGESNIMSLI